MTRRKDLAAAAVVAALPAELATPAPIPPAIDRAAIAKSLRARNILNIQQRLKAGDTLKPTEMRALQDYLDEEGPGALDAEARRNDTRAAPAGSPPDVLAKSQRELADLCGMHPNTIGNLKKSGVALGAPPFSVRDFFLLLRRHNKLGDTRPQSEAVVRIRLWCFGNGDAADPDDPAHGDPAGWGEEGARQSALKQVVARKSEQIELETLQRERIPADEVREALRVLRVQISGIIDSAVDVAASIAGLTKDQQAALSDALQAWRVKARAEIARVCAPKAFDKL